MEAAVPNSTRAKICKRGHDCNEGSHRFLTNNEFAALMGGGKPDGEDED